jgi:hypothetical protein
MNDHTRRPVFPLAPEGQREGSRWQARNERGHRTEGPQFPAPAGAAEAPRMSAAPARCVNRWPSPLVRGEGAEGGWGCHLPNIAFTPFPSSG